VREDYSADGDAWRYLPYGESRSKAYRWGENAIAGICNRFQLLCFAPTFWNQSDTHLKERLFGLTPFEGNHGEDVKEDYFHVDNTPTHSFMSLRYRYPQRAFPYEQLVAENQRRQGGRSTNSSTRVCLPKTAGLTSSSNTPRRRPRRSPSGSRLSIAGQSRRYCTCSRRSGFATPGHAGRSRNRSR